MRTVFIVDVEEALVRKHGDDEERVEGRLSPRSVLVLRMQKEVRRPRRKIGQSEMVAVQEKLEKHWSDDITWRTKGCCGCHGEMRGKKTYPEKLGVFEKVRIFSSICTV